MEISPSTRWDSVESNTYAILPGSWVQGTNCPKSLCPFFHHSYTSVTRMHGEAIIWSAPLPSTSTAFDIRPPEQSYSEIESRNTSGTHLHTLNNVACFSTPAERQHHEAPPTQLAAWAQTSYRANTIYFPHQAGIDKRLTGSSDILDSTCSPSTKHAACRSNPSPTSGINSTPTIPEADTQPSPGLHKPGHMQDQASDTHLPPRLAQIDAFSKVIKTCYKPK